MGPPASQLVLRTEAAVVRLRSARSPTCTMNSSSSGESPVSVPLPVGTLCDQTFARSASCRHARFAIPRRAEQRLHPSQSSQARESAPAAASPGRSSTKTRSSLMTSCLHRGLSSAPPMPSPQRPSPSKLTVHPDAREKLQEHTRPVSCLVLRMMGRGLRHLVAMRSRGENTQGQGLRAPATDAPS